MANFSPPVFKLGVAHLDQLPNTPWPEIAFAGRSNVGKSSLINALAGSEIARVSNTPGRTQQLNFFNLGDRMYWVDMPGYGYAEAPKELVRNWQMLLRDYLLGRTQLRRIYALIDSRHGIKAVDTEWLKELDKAAVSYQIVLTKTDKIKPDALIKLVAETTAAVKKHPAAYPEVLTTSSEKGDGIDHLRALILATS